MKKSDIDLLPEYFDRYINLVADEELSQAFDESIEQLNRMDISVLSRLAGKSYAAEKWTVNEVLQHVIDFERILTYRALLFARRENLAAQSIDQDLLAAKSNANKRAVTEIVAELKAVRLATKLLFDSFDNETLQETGINWKYETSVLAMGFVIIGHQLHHLKIIEDKYFPLLELSGFDRSDDFNRISV